MKRAVTKTAGLAAVLGLTVLTIALAQPQIAEGHSLLQHANSPSGVWQIQNPPLPSTNNGANLNSVSCAATTLCIAVGPDGGAGFNTIFAEMWNGTGWSQTFPPGPSGPPMLTAVACVSVDFCMAVGGSAAGPLLFDEWNGSTWVQLPNPSTTSGDPELTAISCSSTTSCIAIGDDVGAGGTAFEWNGLSWSAIAAPPIPVSPSVGLVAVSCPSSSFCMAVSDTGTYSWNGSSWTNVSWPGNSQNQGPLITSVSCTGPSACLTTAGSGIWAWNGSAWSELANSPANSYATRAVSCVTSVCYVAGGGGQSEPQVPAAWSVSGTTVTAQTLPTASGSLEAIDCVSGFCMAVGQTANGAGLLSASVRRVRRRGLRLSDRSVLGLLRFPARSGREGQ